MAVEIIILSVSALLLITISCLFVLKTSSSGQFSEKFWLFILISSLIVSISSSINKWIGPIAIAQILESSVNYLIIATIILASFVNYTKLKNLAKRPLLLFFALFFITPLVISPFSTVSGYPAKMFYGIFVAIALSIILKQYIQISYIVFSAVNLTVVLSACSLGFAFIYPEISLEKYGDSIIGLNTRMHGLTSHANTLGWLASIAIVASFFDAKKRNSVWIFLILGSVLVWTQSKTSWGIFGIGSAMVIYYRLRYIDNVSMRYAFRLAVGISIVFMSSWIMLDNSASGNEFDVSFTGRSVIWEQSLSEFRENEFFGYGPYLWTPEYSTALNLEWATQAHNQFLQTLGSSGLVGAMVLLLYIGALLHYSMIANNATRGISLALSIMLIIRSLTESSLQISTFDYSIFAGHILIWMIVYNGNMKNSKAGRENNYGSRK